MPIFDKRIRIGLSIDGAMPVQYRYVKIFSIPENPITSYYFSIMSGLASASYSDIVNNSFSIEPVTTIGQSKTLTFYVEDIDGSYADVISGELNCQSQSGYIYVNQTMFKHDYQGRQQTCLNALQCQIRNDELYLEQYRMDYITKTWRYIVCRKPNGNLYLCAFASAYQTAQGDEWGNFAINSYTAQLFAPIQGNPIEMEYPDAEDDDDDGGGGDFDPSSDPIDFPDGIDVSNLIANAELMNVYAISQASLLLLNDFLWSDNFFDNVKKVFNSPMQSVAGLYVLPFSVLGTSAHIEVGGIDTEIASQKVTDFVKVIDIGELTINEYWGNFLDYENTTVKIYLPFVGFQVLETKKVVGATLSIRYKIDILSGDFQAFIKRTKGGYTHVLYTFSGNMAMQLPLSQSANATLTNSLLGLTQGIGATLVGGGTGALALSAMSTVGSAMAQNAFGDSKTIQHNGSYGGNKGYMGEMTPYIVIERAKQQIPTNYNKFVGVPSYFRTTLSECHGFTKVQSIHLNCSATAEEKNKIETLLKSGVIL